jgi:hypothetical protein
MFWGQSLLFSRAFLALSVSSLPKFQGNITVTFSSVFWSLVVISYWRFGTVYRTHHQGSFWPLKMVLKEGPICCSETFLRNSLYSLCNNPQQRSSHLLPSGSLKSCTYYRQSLNWQYRSETGIFLIENWIYTASFSVTGGYEKGIYWECLGIMCADLEQTVTGWCGNLSNRKLSLLVINTRHEVTESIEILWAGQALCVGKW